MATERNSAMTLKHRNGWTVPGMAEYTCELTEALDKAAGLDPESRFRHYVLDDGTRAGCYAMAIRVPGGTVGSMSVDADRKILEACVSTDNRIVSYPDDIREELDRFLGRALAFPEE